MNNTSREQKIALLKNTVRNIPDFPMKGIQFKDVTTLFDNPACLKFLSEILYEEYKNLGITKVIGIESRGFIMGPIAALELDAGFVPVRKAGKLPAATFSKKYEKEYGWDEIEIHQDALEPDDVVLIHDDLLATGGTMLAAYDLVKRIGVQKIYINFLIEIEALRGKDRFPKDVDLRTFIKF